MYTMNFFQQRQTLQQQQMYVFHCCLLLSSYACLHENYHLLTANINNNRTAFIYYNDEIGTKLILSLSRNNDSECAVAYQSIKPQKFGSFHTVVLLSLISIMTVKHNNAFLLTCYFINYRMSL